MGFSRKISNIALRILEKTAGYKNPLRQICFFGPTLDANIKSFKDYITKNNLHEKHGISLIDLYTKNIKIPGINQSGIFINTFSGVLYYLTKCKILIATNNLFAQDRYPVRNKKSLLIQLWHGLPIKARPKKTKSFNFSNFDLFVSSSSYSSYLLASYMGVPVDKFVVTGYPRNDLLLEPNAKTEALRKLREMTGIQLEEYSKLIVYTPTFRRYDYTRHLEMILDQNIIETVKRNNYFLLVKYHIVDELNNRDIIQKIEMKTRKINNIKIVSTTSLHKSNLTIYDILPAFDVLLTDYSSLANDYLLLDKPIIFYMPDLEQYYREEGLIYPLKSLKDVMPGSIITNTDQLTSHLIESDSYQKQRRTMRNLLHEYIDNKSSARLWQLIENNAL